MSLAQAPDVLSVQDLAHILRVGRNQAYELVRSGAIASVRIGRSIRVPKAAVLRFLGEEVSL